MIYLDGTRFFFDIEGCFSNLVERAREESAGLEHDASAAGIRTGFGKFFGAKPEDIRAGKDMETLLGGILCGCGKIVVPEYDISYRSAFSALPGCEIVTAKKTNDLKIKVQSLAEKAKECDADAVFLSNPCCPVSLENSPAEILSLAESFSGRVIVDESFCVDESASVLKNINEHENLTVLKKMNFGGGAVFAAGKNLPEFDCKIPAEDQSAAKVIFEHDSAIKTAQRKLIDSRDSLYIRIKKLAIKFDSLERLYRSKGNCVFFKVKNAAERAKALEDSGIKVLLFDDGLCVFAGEKDENEAVLKALEEVLR